MFYVVEQEQYFTDIEGNFNVIAKYEYKEEAQKLVDAKEVAYSLEKQSVNNHSDKLRFFVVVKVEDFLKE